MPAKTQSRTAPNSEQRKRRIQQIVFNLLAILVIISWIISLIAH
ncbi:hypothetical protein hrd7_06580 [Leptolinea sp. HRD-7]|jgi:hypothetical protein|nr:hypothetical protein hrd7_06580 [Leptolinea sp. HRD-7]